MSYTSAKFCVYSKWVKLSVYCTYTVIPVLSYLTYSSAILPANLLYVTVYVNYRKYCSLLYLFFDIVDVYPVVVLTLNRAAI
jgi:hypothetical protein